MSAEMVILLAKALLQYGPEVAKSLHDIFTKTDPTKADWDALFALALSKSYDDYVNPKPAPHA